MLKLHVILGRITAKRLSVSARTHTQKRERALFSAVTACAPTAVLKDGLKMTRTAGHTFIFANLFVLRYGNTHFALCKSF